MSKTHKLLQNTLIYSIGNFGSKFLSFLLIPIYSFFLSKSELGFFDLVVVTSSLCIPFITLQISDSAYRWLLDVKDVAEETPAIISNSLMIIVNNTVLGLIAFSIYMLFWPVQYGLLLVGYFVSQCFQPYFQQVVRGLRQNKLYAFCGILNAFVLVFSNVIFLYFLNLGIEALFLSTILANCSTILVVIFKVNIFKFFSFKHLTKSTIQDLIRYSAPLIPNVVSWWMISSANRYIILNFLGQDSNGIYALAIRFPAILAILNSIFALSWQESAITEYNDKERDSFYSKIFKYFFVLEISSVIVLIAVSRVLIDTFVDSKFAEAWKYLPFLYLGVAFSAFSAFLGTGYLSSKNTKGAFTTTIFGALVNVGLSILLVPILGLQGAAIGTACGFLATWIVRSFQTRKYFKINVNYYEVVGLLSLTLLFSFLVLTYTGFWATIFIILASMVTFVYVNRIILINKIYPIIKRKLLKI